MIHADYELAYRLEGLIIAEYRRLAVVGHAVLPCGASEVTAVAGGVALWLGEGSPVNQAVGLGMNGPIDEDELERLESFYHERGIAATVSICPLAHASLIAGLGRRGWRASQFEHVLVLELAGEGAGGPADAGARAGGDVFEVRPCTYEERGLWAHLAALGFADGRSPGPGEEEFGTIMAAREEAVLVLAWVEGRPAGTGCLVIDGGVGWLSGDSTLPEHRRRGVQQAIQSHRLSLAREAGCDLAVTEAAPGGSSQRNMERLGFRIAYTHVEFTKQP